MNKCLDLVVGEDSIKLMGISFSLEQLKLGNDGILYFLEDAIANNSFIMEQLDAIVSSAQELKLGLFTLTEALTNPSSVPGNLSYKKLGLFVNMSHTTTTKYKKSLTQLAQLLHNSGVDLNQSDIVFVDNIAYPGIYTDLHGFKIIIDSDSINNAETVLLCLLFAYHTHQLSVKNPIVMKILTEFIKETDNTKLALLTARQPRETDKTYYNRILSILFSNDVNLTDVETMEFIDRFIGNLNGIASEEVKKLTGEKFSFAGEVRYSTNKNLNDLASGYYNLFLKYESEGNTPISVVNVDEFVKKLSSHINITNYTNYEVRSVILNIADRDPKLLGLLYDNIGLFNIDTFYELQGKAGELYELLQKSVGVSGDTGKVPNIDSLTNRVINKVVTTLDIGALAFRFVTEKDITNTKYFEIVFRNLDNLPYKVEKGGSRIVINSKLLDISVYDKINSVIQQGGKNAKILLPTYLNDRFIINTLANLDVTNKSVSVTNVTHRMVPIMYNLASALYVDELTVFTNENIARRIRNTDYSYMKKVSDSDNLYTSRYYLPLGTKTGNGDLVHKITKLTDLNYPHLEISNRPLERGTILTGVEGLEGQLIVIQNDREGIKIFNTADGEFYDLTEDQVFTLEERFKGVKELTKLKNISNESNTIKFALSPYYAIEFKLDGDEWETDGVFNEISTHSVIAEADITDDEKFSLLAENQYYIENVNDSLYLVQTKQEDSDISSGSVVPQADSAYRFNIIKELLTNAGITKFNRLSVEELNSIHYDSNIYNLSRGVYITDNMNFIVPEELNILEENSEEYKNALRNIESRLYTTWAMKADADTFNDQTDGASVKEKFQQFNNLVLTDKIQKKSEGLQALFGDALSIENFIQQFNVENYSIINSSGNLYLETIEETNTAKLIVQLELNFNCD